MTTRKVKHTPGPWHVDADAIAQAHDADRSIYHLIPINPKQIHLAGGRTHNQQSIARVYGDGPLSQASPERVANAVLIAAAPALLDALRDLLDMVTDNRTHGPEIDRACEAIAQAEGER